MRIAVVTPYYKESIEVLRRCHESVLAQGEDVVHYMVADGHPNPELDSWKIRHIVLPVNFANYGVVPRGVGAITAFAEGADAVGMLDADNWLEPGHGAQISKLMEGEPELIFAMRRILFPDGDELYKELGNEVIDDRIYDTNCLVLTRKASYLAAIWSMFPRQFGVGEETPLFRIVKAMSLKVAYASKPTVCYLTNWDHHYHRAGKKPLLATRTPSHAVQHVWNSDVYKQATGIDLRWFHKRAGPGPKPIDAKRPNVFMVTPTDGEDVTAEWCDSVSSLGFEPTHLLIGRQRPDFAGSNDRRIWFELPFPESRPMAFEESIGAVCGFQLGADIVLFLRAGCPIDETEIRALISKATKLKANTRDFTITKSNSKLHDAPTDTPLDMVAVPRTIAGRFIQRNLARGVPGFTGRGWKRVLDT